MTLYKKILWALFLIFVFVSPSCKKNKDTASENNTATNNDNTVSDAKNPPEDILEKVFDNPVALIRAVKADQVDVARNLIDTKNINVNFQDTKGRTPLHYAAAINNSEEMVRLLLERGVDVNVRDKNGRTALDLVNQLSLIPPDVNRTKVIKLLRSAGAS